MQLNLVFHNIVSSPKDLKNIYTVTLDYYLDLLKKLDNAPATYNALFSQYHIYFDDGDASFNDLVFPKIVDFSKFTLAVVTDDIGKKGYLTKDMLKKYDHNGIIISSHGVSHSSLAFYENGVLQKTPSDGLYINSEMGQKRSLSENEILYQLRESKIFLRNLLRHDIDEFVLPYGIYNDSILNINETNHVYNFISTCDEYLDRGKKLRPRFLVNNTRSVSETIFTMLQLK